MPKVYVVSVASGCGCHHNAAFILGVFPDRTTAEAYTETVDTRQFEHPEVAEHVVHATVESREAERREETEREEAEAARRRATPVDRSWMGDPDAPVDDLPPVREKTPNEIAEARMRARRAAEGAGRM